MPSDLLPASKRHVEMTIYRGHGPVFSDMEYARLCGVYPEAAVATLTECVVALIDAAGFYVTGDRSMIEACEVGWRVHQHRMWTLLTRPGTNNPLN